MDESGIGQRWGRSIAGLAIGLGVIGCNAATGSPPAPGSLDAKVTVPGSASPASPTPVPASATPPPASAASSPAPSVPPIPDALIAFTSKREGKEQIFTIKGDGSDVVRITNDASDDHASAWSGDHSRLLFSSNRGGHDEIYVMNADGTGQKRLAPSDIPASGASWSPDGKTVIFNAKTSGSSCYQVFSMRADGSGRTQLTTGSACNWAPVWSPDGRHIAFSTNRDGNFNLELMRPDGSEQERISTEMGRNDAFPIYSPDGTKLLFTSWAESMDGTSAEVYVMDLDDSGRLQLTDNKVDDSYPTWSPDGSWVAFQSNRDGNPEIYAMLPDGSAPTRLTNEPADDVGAVWR